MLPEYDVIVVGAGHAGSEAAAAAANLGSRVLLITMDMTKIAQMSCNPAMGGIAKGQIVREIDALGGYSAIVTDKSTIQFRMLNRSKGPAMWSPRAQCDRMLFTLEWRKILEQIPSLDFWQDKVNDLIIEDGRVKGVVTNMGVTFYSKAVILTNGTFLNGLIHIGLNQLKGGRMAEPPATGLTEKMMALGFETGRMKTGTPVRIDGRSVDFTKFIEQHGDEQDGRFSYYLDEENLLIQRPCYIARTDQMVHDELARGFEHSPMFNGTIQSIGPRYCPSIEDKIVTFRDKDSHQLFLEPEGESTIEFYLNGFSSSLPLDIQLSGLQKIKGFENARIFRPGYAIEYDFFMPTQLFHTLETKLVEGLYFAGQINGTTGYEEAGAQGIIAGINAHQKIYARDEFVLKRDQAYIGVLIDDLVTKGVDEPYRMFTSRAEYRILLRQDNADERLTGLGYKLGLVTETDFNKYSEKYRERDRIVKFINEYSIDPSVINNKLEELGTSPLKQKVKLRDVLLRPQVQLQDLIPYVNELQPLLETITRRKDELLESVEIFVKYAGYIEREKQMADKLKRLENIKISYDINYDELLSISTEGRQKLNKVKPKTIGQASRISGVSPSDINVLLVYLGR